MDTTTDFNKWLEAASVDDENELYSLYKCVEDEADCGIFNCATSNDGKLFIQVGNVTDQLMIASTAAKDTFLNILSRIEINNSRIADFPDADSWLNYNRAMSKRSPINKRVDFCFQQDLTLAMNKIEKAKATAKIKQRYDAVKDTLNERSRRLFVASEAMTFGYGGIAAAVRATGMVPSVIGRGIAEVKAIEAGWSPEWGSTRSRRPGAGRRKITEKDPTLLPDLKELLESTTRGDPESPLLWSLRSQRNLVAALAEKGHTVAMKTVAKLLKEELGYSLQANSKRMEGAQHPDRNAQFEHINETVRRQIQAGEPAISVDTKKKEMVGNYKNDGVELRPKSDPEIVNVHDFVDPELGRAAPYGVYDIAENEAWVSVGISHDTGEFAVQSIRTWWYEMGKPLYPSATSLLITADGGGSNGYRLRLWKVELQNLANELGISIRVCHLPPGTSKWNKIEHRLFSFITRNWRGKPLVTHQVIVELIKGTTTRTGLKVRSRIDEKQYAKGKRISDRDLAEVNLEPHAFHGEWNYAIHPLAKTTQVID